MSIRLHELAKRIGMDNKQLLALLKERAYPVKTVSSTIDKITAEALEQELVVHAPAVAPAPPVAPAAAPPGEGPAGDKGAAAVAAAPSDKPPTFTTRVPMGVFVKSAQDIAREKEELARASRPQVVFPAPRPASPVMRVTPPVPSRAPFAPPPVARPPVAPPAPVRTAPPMAPPVPPPVARPAPVPPPLAVPPPVASTPPVPPQIGRAHV